MVIVIPDSEPSEIQLRHVGSNTNPVGTTHKFIAKLLDQNNMPMPNVSINGGIIEGVNHHSFGGTTDANGKCTFSYKGEKAGVDNIEIYWEEPPGHMGPPIAYLTKTWIAKKKRRTPSKAV